MSHSREDYLNDALELTKLIRDNLVKVDVDEPWYTDEERKTIKDLEEVADLIRSAKFN